MKSVPKSLTIADIKSLFSVPYSNGEAFWNCYHYNLMLKSNPGTLPVG